MSATDSTTSTKRGFFKPPTRDELQSAKETVDLFGSNLLKLQISELLSEVSPPNSYPVQLDEYLKSVKTLLKNLCKSDRVKLCDGLSLLHEDVEYPLSSKPDNPVIKGYFQFHPPKSISVVGSFLLNTQLKNSRHVDLVMRIPEECLQPKDILNYRYFHKRALYLSLIAGHCKDNPLFQSVHCVAEDPLLPMIELTPSDPALACYPIVIHSTLPDNYFPLHKLYPDRNNVRLDTNDMESVPATPRYNAKMLMESGSMKNHLEDIYSAINDCPSIREAIILYRVWSKQREFTKRYGCFSSFHFSMLLVYLLKKSKIFNRMSCYQVFIVAMKFIVDTDLTTQGISILNRSEYPTLPSIQMYHLHYDVVFIDGRGLLNICSHVTSEQFNYFRDEARLALTHSFNSLFLESVPMLLKYDGTIRIDVSDIESIKGSNLLNDHEWVSLECDHRGWVTPLVVKKLINIIRRGFEGRVQLISQNGYPFIKWSISSKCDAHHPSSVVLGLVYVSDHVYNNMTIGPQADSIQAKNFRSFWGDISEVRRFEDGGIHEAVPWNDKTSHAKLTIPYQILTHILTRHGNITKDYVMTNMDGRLENVLTTISCIDSETCINTVITAYTRLRRILRSFKNLPLLISTVQCSSPILSHSEVPCYRCSTDLFKSVFADCHAFCEVIVQLEASNKWPLELNAIQHMITLFYVELNSSLAKEGLKCQPTNDFIDVILDGHMFRLMIHYPPMLQLIKTHTPSSYNEYEMTHVIKPQVASFLTGIQGVWPSYGVGVRLCKKWISSHLLSDHVPQEVIELMVAYLYHCPQPFKVTNSPDVVFYRFLALLGSHDWSHDPLIVNIDGSIPDDKVVDLKHKYSTSRADYPCMGVISQFDSTSSWTQNKPEYPVLHRLVLLAKTSLSFISDNVFNQSINLKQLFQTSYADYDAIIHLKTRLNEKRLPRVKNQLLLSDFDPIPEYLSILKKNFSEFALFFFDKYRPLVICVLWRPLVKQSHTFKIINGYSLVKEDKEHYKINKSTLLTDMAIMGDGVVLKVEEN